MRAGAQMAFWTLRRWACVRFARRPGSVCCESGSKLDTVVVASFDRFYFRGGKGAEEDNWRGVEREHTYGQRQLKMPFPRLKVDLRRTLWVREMARNNVLALFAPKQSVSINHLQLNAPTGGQIPEENAEERFNLRCTEPTWRFGDGTDRFSSTCSKSSDGKSWQDVWIKRRMVGRWVSWRALVKVGSDKRREP